MRQGLTLIETLLALALLSGVTLAGTAWLQTSVRTSHDVAASSRWRGSAEALLRCIGDDLACRDLPVQTTQNQQPPSPVSVDGDTLTIQTRRADHREYNSSSSIGSELPKRTYVFDPDERAVFIATTRSSSISPPTHVPLLGDVIDARFSLSVDGRLLTVRLENTLGHTAARNYVLLGDG